jgi:hypothetical protein
VDLASDGRPTVRGVTDELSAKRSRPKQIAAKSRRWQRRLLV